MTNTTTTTTATREFNGTTLPTPGTFVLDKSHTQIGFVARHLMVSKVRGRFTDYEGAIVVDDDPAKSSVEVTIQTASINTNDENRDNHVRTNDFLAVEEFPTMTFRSTKVELGSAESWKVTGDLDRSRCHAPRRTRCPVRRRHPGPLGQPAPRLCGLG